MKRTWMESLQELFELLALWVIGLFDPDEPTDLGETLLVLMGWLAVAFRVFVLAGLVTYGIWLLAVEVYFRGWL
jgi:hypothetical protein